MEVKGQDQIEKVLSQITVNTQSSIQVTGIQKIVFDPLDIREETHDADLVFFTHSHSDHFSPSSFAAVAKEDTLFIAPRKMEKELEQAGIGRERRLLLSPGEKADAKGVPVLAVWAYNRIKPMHPRHNGWLGYLIGVEGVRVYVLGDTDVTAQSRRIRCDIMLPPIGGTFTMNAKQAAKLVNEVQPKVVIPTHYGSIVGTVKDGETFEKMVDPSIRVVHKLFPR